jgi:hypothetical protein
VREEGQMKKKGWDEGIKRRQKGMGEEKRKRYG